MTRGNQKVACAQNWHTWAEGPSTQIQTERIRTHKGVQAIGSICAHKQCVDDSSCCPAYVVVDAEDRCDVTIVLCLFSS
eukprot:2365706-Amphidinium_carterae.2